MWLISWLRRRLHVNLKQVLTESALEPHALFECLCERDRVRLWPWLRDAQVATLQELLLSRPTLQRARLAFDSVTARHRALTRCSPTPCALHGHQALHHDGSAASAHPVARLLAA